VGTVITRAFSAGKQRLAGRAFAIYVDSSSARDEFPRGFSELHGGLFNAAPSPCGIELTRSVWNSDTVTCDTPVASGRPRDSWSDRCESRSSTSFDRIVRDRGSRTARSSRAAVQPVVLRSNAVNARSSVVQREVTARSSVALRGQRWCTVQPVVQRSNARSLPRDRSCAARSLRMKKQRRSPGPLQANVRK